MISTINQLADYFNRTETPAVFHQVGTNSFDVFVMEEDYPKVAADLEWELPSMMRIRFQTLKSKSEFRRINCMFEHTMKRINASTAEGDNLKNLGKLMGLD
jgi:hypothetical protein